MRAIILAALLVFMVTPAFAADTETKQAKQASPKEVYELSEKCSKSAAEKFKQNVLMGVTPPWGWSKYDDGTDMSTTYSNHYSAKLNKCLLLVTITHFEKSGVWFTRIVRDVHENKEIAILIYSNSPSWEVLTCKVLDQACSSESEWDSLLKPYMEE